jgi:hypothetical protein
MKSSRPAGIRNAAIRSLLAGLAPPIALACALAAGPALAGNLVNNGGPIMQNTTRAYLIFWLPAGVVLDSGQTNGIGNFETLMQRFYADVSGSSYLNIVTQYPGTCGSNQCVLQNGAGAAALGGSWVDTQAYPNNRGTATNALQDSDIQNEVTRAINQNNWTVDGNSEFFVVTGQWQATGAGVVECSGSNCTAPGGFCAYHSNFSLSGNTVLYGYLSDASFNSGGCGEGTSTATNGQLSSDRQVALMTHEWFETITDPLGNAWWDSNNDSTKGNEIGDNCNQIGASIAMNGNNYWVQQQWDNVSSSCVSAFVNREQVVCSVFDDGYANLTGRSDAVFINDRKQACIPDGTPGGTCRKWFGRCQSTLTGTAVNFNVFDDGYANLAGPSDAVFINGGLQACLPNGTAGGNCRRWFGRAQATDGRAASCAVFGDGYTTQSNFSDAVYIGGGETACIPNGSAQGICQKWWGRCQVPNKAGGGSIALATFLALFGLWLASAVATQRCRAARAAPPRRVG